VEGKKISGEPNFDTFEDGAYWTNGKEVYFLHTEIKGVDIKTFMVIKGIEVLHQKIDYAKDKNKYYFGSKVISKDEFEKEVGKKRARMYCT